MKTALHNKLSAALKPLEIEVIDESHKHAGHVGARPGGNTHFHIRIISDAFTNLSRVERHRFVHDLFKEELATTIHALSLDLKSPQESS